MSDEKLVPFTDCSRTALDIRVSNEAALEILKAEPADLTVAEDGLESPCVILAFSARSIGDATVTVTIGGLRDGPLTSTTRISVYAPLKIVSPADNQLSLTPTSSYAVAFVGGPRPLFADSSSHFVAAERLGKTGVDYFETSSVTEENMDSEKTKVYSFVVSCLSGTPTPSEASLLISVGNRKTATNKYPALSTLKMKIVCDFPTSISLQLKRMRSPYDSVNLPPCPLDDFDNLEPKPVYYGAKFDLLAKVFDADGRVFDNASAVHFTWHVSDSTIVRSPTNRPRALQWQQAGKWNGSYECKSFLENFDG